jgi:hypothetical protein
VSDSAKKLLDNNEIHELKWDGYTIGHCFRIATALAELEAKKPAHYRNGEEIVVEAEQFKDAINMVADSKRVEATSNDSNSRRKRPEKLMPPKPGDSWREKWIPSSETTMAMLLPITSDSERNLCIPDLNRIEWEGFKAAASSEVFRKTKFYALDVLRGEPVIKLQTGKKTSRRRNLLVANRTEQKALEHPKGETRQDTTVIPPGQVPLPERIRINSTTIMHVFQEILDEGASGPKHSVLFFRPFRSLVYYEHEFRDWITRQEMKLQGKS